MGHQDNNIPVLFTSVICIHVKAVARTPSTTSKFPCKTNPSRDVPLRWWGSPTKESPINTLVDRSKVPGAKETFSIHEIVAFVVSEFCVFLEYNFK